MRTSISTLSLFFSLFALPIFAQDRTTINATSSEISDNLDLRAIASIFGDAKNLEDFERQLNDPNTQISNLDLNSDNQVDYLRVIESVEGNAHLIIVQSVLGKDNYQDVATIEVEKDRNNQVQVQVVGDVFMYGENYIYEPIYVATPIIYSTFWIPTYRPYCSLWYWNYYPTFYYAWQPWPVFRYRNHISLHININHHYNYTNTRHCHRALALYDGRRSNYCERTSPSNSFTYRNKSVKNRFELDQTRTVKNVARGSELAYTGSRKNDATPRQVNDTRNTSNSNSTSRGETTPTRNTTSVSSNETNRETISRLPRNPSSDKNTTEKNTIERSNSSYQNSRAKGTSNGDYVRNKSGQTRIAARSRTENSGRQRNTTSTSRR